MDYLKLKDELTRDECLGGKLALDAYVDSKGYWTIGRGHLLGKSAPGQPPRMSRITPGEAEALYEWDLKGALGIVRRSVPAFDMLDDVRQRALVNMAFNRGGHMVDSTTITPAINAAVKNGDWAAVRVAILGDPPARPPSEWATQVKGRAVRLATMLETGMSV
jgi:lysozyme